MFNDGIAGFEVIDGGPPCSLMPFALSQDSWIDAVTNGHGADAFSYNSDTCMVSPGADGTVEINLYPEKGNTPGNFGTVDIGNTNNSTVDLSRQILNGPTAADLAPYGGTLELDPTTKNFEVNGECGVSAALKDDLEAIIGIPRTIMLFDQVTAVGETSYYRIVGFAGLTIVDVDLTTGNKHVTVQPTWVTDPTVILGDSGLGDYVRHPPQLVQ
jgi:hypothetical protein